MRRAGKTEIVMFVVLVLTPCGFIVWALWSLMEPLSLSGVRIWAILTTLALPLVALVSFIFGRREAGVKVDGLDIGIEKVMGMAERVADIRDRSASKIRPPVQQVAVLPQTQLPNPTIMHLERPKEDMVDL